MLVLRKNQQLSLQIDGYTSEGAGVGKVDGVAVFVPGTVVGETVKAHLIKVNKTYAVGKLLDVLTPSPCRMEPTCRQAGKCGGCCFRHMTYEAELAQKHRRVADAFARIGGFDLSVGDIVPSPEQDGYRNKAMFPAGEGNGRKVFGFYSKHSHRVVEVPDCRLLPAEVLSLRQAAEDWLDRSGNTVYNEESGEGTVRHLYIRRGYHSGEIAVCLVVNGKSVKGEQDLIDSLRQITPHVVSVLLNVNRKPGNTVLGKETVCLWGKETISDTLCGNEITLSPHAFYQVNTCQAQRLYSLAGQVAGEGETLVDLYCGAGTIGLSMSRRFREIIGVEIVPEAVENARENAKRNGVENARFVTGDAANAAALLKDEGITPDVVVLDPPRKGCTHDLLQTVAAMAPKRIVYVSCDPATCARDSRLLAALGYALQSVTPVDMFPRTGHVETVALLSRQKVTEHIYIDVNIADLPKTTRTTATYPEIKAYIKDKYGLCVSSLNIAQMKEKHGFEKRENYNKGKEGHRVPKCPPEKEKAIEDAFKHFGML